MRSLHIFISILLGGAQYSLASEDSWTAFITRDTLKVVKPGSGDLTIEANGGYLWIGKMPSANCPKGVDNLDCSVYKVNQTAFVGANDFGDGALSLNVVVPGGQQVYIAPDGTLGYTVPHSASKPQGSDVAVFGRGPLTVGGKELVLWTSSGDFVACTTDESGEYQIFVKVPGFVNSGDCTLLMIRTRAANITSSWEY